MSPQLETVSKLDSLTTTGAWRLNEVGDGIAFLEFDLPGESVNKLSEAVLVDIGVAMGPVIASIHEKRDEFRGQIEQEGALTYKPKLRTSTAEV